jgi:hypothetical protein
MFSGYFNMGGGSPYTLPVFSPNSSGGNITGSRHSGSWLLETDLSCLEIDIPSRDKTVKVWGSSDNRTQFLLSKLAIIDSDLPGTSYRDKLIEHNTGATAFILNINKDTHGSFAIVAGPNTTINMFGVLDTKLGSSYILWGTGHEKLSALLNSDPLRFLVYRLPPVNDSCVFVQAEAICSRWWRWTRTNQSHLQAFNALEHKLYGHP